MLRNLENVIRSIVNSNWNTHNCYNRNENLKTPTLFMEIPTNKEEFEVPAFALDILYYKKRDCPELDKLVAFFYSSHVYSGYTSVDGLVRSVLNESFIWSNLVTLRVKDKDHVTNFFGTEGALFYPNGYPMLMFTWKVRLDRDNPDCPFHLIRPLLRIHPSCYRKENPLEKYILNKIIPLSLYGDYEVQIRCGGVNISSEIEYDTPLVLFEEPKFRIRKVRTPSIDTENQELLDIAYEYFDDVKI